jgi:shikimate kinase
MILKLTRTPGIFLVGFMGCGKSMVGANLAERLGWAFADIDSDIERERNTTISDIFDTLGEEEFRKIESDAILKRVHVIQSGHPIVVALGGGVFGQTQNWELVENNGVSIWLDCPLSLIRQRLAGCTHRPLARDPRKFDLLYYTRRETYARADYHIEVTGNDAGAVVDAVLSLPLF